MSAPKLITLFGLLAKNEATYGAGGSLSASTDAIWLQEPIRVPLEYQHDGIRAMGPDTGGKLLDAVPKGRFVNLPGPKIEGRGAGTAYSASNFSRDLHCWMKGSGHKHTVVVTGGSESVTYTPSRLRADWASIFASGYSGEELLTLLAGWCDLQLDIEAGGPAVFTFPSRFLLSAMPSDAAVPAMTFQAPTVQPPRAEGLALSLKDITSSTTWANVPVRRLSLKLNRQIGGNRTNVSVAGGLSGWSLGGYDPMLQLRLEASALAGSPYVATTGADPYQLRDTKRKLEIAFSVGVGGTGNYNRLEFLASNAQIRAVTPDSEEPDALWTLDLHLAVSAPGADDAYNLVTK